MHLKQVRIFPEKGPTREHYPFNLPLFHRTESVAFTTPVTFFVGENGTGKSTLLKALARKCRIHIWKNEEGTRFDRNPYEDKLFQFIDVRWEEYPVPGSYFDSSFFRDFAVYVDEWAASDPGLIEYFGGKSLMSQSHGQSLMSFFKSRYTIRGLYMLDEPETALSPKSQIELLNLLMDAGPEVQFVVATHSPILTACPGARIYSFDRSPIAPIAYEETSHYRVYRDFMLDREKYVGKIGGN